MADEIDLPSAYLIEVRAGDYLIYTPDEFSIDAQAGFRHARVYPLFRRPQPGCSATPSVWKSGRSWHLHKHHAYNGKPGDRPLYPGPAIEDGHEFPAR